MSGQPKTALTIHRGGGRRPKEFFSQRLALVVSDFLGELSRFAPHVEIMRAATKVAPGPKMEDSGLAIERIRSTLLRTEGKEDYAVHLRAIFEALSMKHSLKAWNRWLHDGLGSGLRKTDIVETLLNFYLTLGARVLEEDPDLPGWR